MKGLDLKGTTKSDLALYLAIGLIVATFGILYGVYTARAGEGGDLPLRWIGLAGATAVTFGYPVRWYRRYWGSGPFWAALVGVLLIHLGAYIEVILTTKPFGLIWFALITPMEWTVICPILERAGKFSRTPASRPPGSSR